MALRPRRYRDLTAPEKAVDDSINARYQAEHDTLSNAFYQKKNSSGVTQLEETTFRTMHDALQPKYDQERLAAGLFEEYDEAVELLTAWEEMTKQIKLLPLDKKAWLIKQIKTRLEAI